MCWERFSQMRRGFNNLQSYSHATQEYHKCQNINKAQILTCINMIHWSNNIVVTNFLTYITISASELASCHRHRQQQGGREAPLHFWPSGAGGKLEKQQPLSKPKKPNKLSSLRNRVESRALRRKSRAEHEQTLRSFTNLDELSLVHFRWMNFVWFTFRMVQLGSSYPQ